MSNASNLSTLANVLDDGSDGQFLKSTGSGGVAFDTVAAGAVVYATADLLPLSGNSAGDMAYVTATNRFYINNGSGWYSVSLVNTNPNITSVQDAGSNTTPFTLATDGTATVITVTAADPEEVPLTYDYSVTSGSLNGSTVTKGTGSNSNVFTVTPHASQDATFTITFTASDGINQATSANEFSLSFVTIVTDSNHTTLLATATGTSDNNNITDSSSNSYSITVTGDAYAGTFSPYRSGGYSVHLDDGEEISFPDSSNYNLSNGSFSIEAWVYPTSYDSPWSGVISQFSSSSRGWGLAFSSTQITFLGSTNGGSSTNVNGSVTSSVPLNQWTHLLVTRDSNTIRIFNNGVLVNNFIESGTFNNSTNPLRIGELNSAASENFRGYIKDARVVKGSVPTEYQTSSTTNSTTIFSVPSEPLIAVTDTVLLSCHLPYISDGSTNNATPTLSGNVSTKPFSPYDYDEYDAADHGGSVFLGGTAHDSEDRLEITRDTSLTMGSGDFTYEAWVYLYSEDVANEASLFSARASGYESFILKVRNSGTEGTNLLVSNSTGNSWSVLNTKGGAVFANVWTHVAIVRNGTSIKVYTNGKEAQSHTFSGSLNEDNNTLYIGYDSDSRYGLGHVSDVRITKGTAVYTTDFTPPTAPLSSSGASLHIKGTDASIIDKSQGSNLKLEGNTTGSTTQVKFSNTKSMYFDGTGDMTHSVLPVPLANQATIEFWMYSSATNKRYIFAIGLYGVSSVLGIDTGSGTFSLRATSGTSGSTTQIIAGGAFLANTWYHVAIVRDGTTYELYVDGISKGTGTYGTATHYDSSYDVTIGSLSNNGTSASYPWSGYIQDFRITNGYARYTANFTPPSAPLEG